MGVPSWTESERGVHCHSLEEWHGITKLSFTEITVDSSSCTLFGQRGTEDTRFRMPSVGTGGSPDESRAGAEDAARRVSFPEGADGAVAPPPWTYYHKPIIVMAMGALLLGVASALSLLQRARVLSVSRSVGTACLSAGLVFLVTGLVWLPVIKQKLQREGLAQKEHARSAIG